MSFSAPKVEKRVWEFTNMGCNIGFPMLGLYMLRYSLEDDGVRRLRLDVKHVCGSFVPQRSFAQEIARLPVVDFSVLEGVVETNGHAFGPLMLHLLQIRPTIQRLGVVITREEEELCPQDCPCRQPVNWKNQALSLPDLEEVLISYDFKEGNEKVDFLKLLFRCAPGLKRLDVGACGEVYDEICSICGENPHVKCDVSC